MVYIKNVQMIDESELSKLVSETYGRPWCLQQGLMLSNDSTFPFEVVDIAAYPGNEEWCKNAEQQLNAWLALPYPCTTCPEVTRRLNDPWFHEMHFEREHFFDTQIIGWDLGRRGLIPYGTYVIDVSW